MSELVHTAKGLVAVGYGLLVDESLDSSVSANSSNNELFICEIGVLNEPSLSFHQGDLSLLLLWACIWVICATLLGCDNELFVTLIIKSWQFWILEAKALEVDKLSSVERLSWVGNQVVDELNNISVVLPGCSLKKTWNLWVPLGIESSLINRSGITIIGSMKSFDIASVILIRPIVVLKVD